MAYPTFLLNDDGTPLPGIAPLTDRVCFVECDGTHAPLNTGATKGIYSGLSAFGAEYIIQPSGRPAVALGHPTKPAFKGLILGSTSFGDSTWAWSDESFLSGKSYLPGKSLLQAVREAWYSKTCACMGAMPCLPDFRKTGKQKIILESLTPEGVSGSCERWSLMAGAAVAGMRLDVFNALLFIADLADTIKRVTVEVVCDVLGVPPGTDGVLPPINCYTYPKGVPITQAMKDDERAAYVNVAQKVARRANAITLDAPPADDHFAAFSKKVGAEASDDEKRKFWVMWNAVK